MHVFLAMAHLHGKTIPKCHLECKLELFIEIKKRKATPEDQLLDEGIRPEQAACNKAAQKDLLTGKKYHGHEQQTEDRVFNP